MTLSGSDLPGVSWACRQSPEVRGDQESCVDEVDIAIVTSPARDLGCSRAHRIGKNHFDSHAASSNLMLCRPASELLEDVWW